MHRRYRWIEYLEEIGAHIQYILGGQTVIADYISRNGQDRTTKLTVLGVSSLYLSSDLYQNNEIIAEQRDDQDLQLVRQYVDRRCESNSTNILPRGYKRYASNISVSNEGCLLFHHHTKNFIILPENLRQEVLDLCHSDWASGHFGTFKKHRRLLERFWWPNMIDDVKTLVGACDICLRVKPQTRLKQAMGKRAFPSKPLDMISIDFLVEFPVTSKGNIHILVVNDVFSNYIQLYAVKNRLAKTAARCLADYCLWVWNPSKLTFRSRPRL